jgi:hypothetical protein
MHSSVPALYSRRKAVQVSAPKEAEDTIASQNQIEDTIASQKQNRAFAC